VRGLKPKKWDAWDAFNMFSENEDYDEGELTENVIFKNS